MEKRGQIYILAVILLAVAIYSLSTIVNVVQQEEIKGDFKSLSTNFEIESSKLINSVLQSGGNVEDSFANFTFLFTSYSKAKSPNFNIFYALAYGDDIHFGNFMDEEVYVHVPCPGKESCPVGGLKLVGCFSDISARISFDGLNVQFNPEWDDLFNEVLKPKCIKSIAIGDNKEYCLSIGGMMYNLSIDPNVPKIFSLSRLKSGDHILNSAQGEVGQEQVCEGRTEEDCCLEFCHWDPKKGCFEGITVIGISKCGNEICDPGESCGKCPTDCVCCIDGTPDGKCSSDKPKFCDSGNLIDNCNTCNCPIPGQQDCLSDGRCCVKEGEPCDGTFACCSYAFYYCDGTCKKFSELCEDSFDNDGDGKVDCADSDCEGYCSPTKPKLCTGGAWVYDCNKCGCPSGKSCQTDGSCLSLKKFKCRHEYWTGWGDCGDGKPACASGYSWVNYNGKDCGPWYDEDRKYSSLCRKEYWTACSENPSCGSYTKISEQVC